MAVITTSHRHHAEAAGRVGTKAVGGKRAGTGKGLGRIKVGLAGDDQVQHKCRRARAQHLRDDVARQAGRREALAHGQADRHGRVEMAARDRAQRVGTGHHRQAKGQRHAQQANAHARKGGGQHRAAAAAQREPEGAQKLR